MKNIDFSFGIITVGDQEERINNSIDTIEQQNIPNYEVIIIGGTTTFSNRKNVLHVPFDEGIKNQWITKKKNLITRFAKYDNIVYTHDYIDFLPGWYEGWKKFGDNYKVCMNIVLNADGSRFRDWTVHESYINGAQNDGYFVGRKQWECLLPYDMKCTKRIRNLMYFNGSYWVGKKDIMNEFPLDESRCRGDGEDTFWSEQIRLKYNFSMNPFSTVKLLKLKSNLFVECSDSTVKQFDRYDIKGNGYGPDAWNNGDDNFSGWGNKEDYLDMFE